MQGRVYRIVAVVCALVERAPVGTNLGLATLLWAMLSGRLLPARGAVIPALSALGLADREVRRSWAALAYGAWTAEGLRARWQALVEGEGLWRAHRHGGYVPVAVDLTDFVRPRLADCPTTHYNNVTGVRQPSIPVGIVARVGSVGGQRLALPLALVRAPAGDPGRQAHNRATVERAAALLGEAEAAVFDRGFPLSLLRAAGCARYLARRPRNFTARRAQLPPYRGGRPPKRGEVVRPLARARNGKLYPATPPDRVESWEEDGLALRAEWWDGLLLPEDLPREAPAFAVAAIHDPRYAEPLLLATPLALSGRAARDLYADRWPVEQLPLAAKQMVGAHRQFVHAPECRRRLPELALLAGAALSYLAATGPAIPTGSWDRRPAPTPGRLRRALARAPFPEFPPANGRIREKPSPTAHLPKGHFGQCRRNHHKCQKHAQTLSGN
jgi:hypothetical protein